MSTKVTGTQTNAEMGRTMSPEEALAREAEAVNTTTVVEEVESEKERYARFARVMNRGVISSRMNVELPPEVWGEWVNADPGEVARKEALGFAVDDKYAVANKLHSDGTGKPRIGDLVFMTCSMRDHEMHEKFAKNEYDKAHGKKTRAGRRVVQKEESDYQDLTDKRNHLFPAIQESSVSEVREHDIKAALGLQNTVNR